MSLEATTQSAPEETDQQPKRAQLQAKFKLPKQQPKRILVDDEDDEQDTESVHINLLSHQNPTSKNTPI